MRLLYQDLFVIAAFAIAGCGSDPVGVEPPQGFSNEVIDGPAEADVPPIVVANVAVWKDDSVAELQMPAAVQAGEMLHFDGVIENPHFPGTAFIRVRVLDGNGTVVTTDSASPGPREREGSPTYNADLEEDEYRIAVRAPREPGAYDVEVSYLAFPVGTTPEMFPDPWPEGYEPPKQERFVFATGELTVVESQDSDSQSEH